MHAHNLSKPPPETVHHKGRIPFGALFHSDFDITISRFNPHDGLRRALARIMQRRLADVAQIIDLA